MRSPWRGQVCVQENGLIGLNHWKKFRGPGAESPSSGIVLICRKLHPKPPWKNECQKNLFKIQFLKTVPQIKYDHTFKKGFFDWRQLFFCRWTCSTGSTCSTRSEWGSACWLRYLLHLRKRKRKRKRNRRRKIKGKKKRKRTRERKRERDIEKEEKKNKRKRERGLLKKSCELTSIGSRISSGKVCGNFEPWEQTY